MPYTTQTSDFWGWYLRHNNRVVWSHLYDAGLDTFTTGPSSNTQAFLQLSNVLPAMNGGFQTRWGVSSFVDTSGVSLSNNGINRTFLYNYPQDASDPTNTTNTNLIIGTDDQNFYVYKDNATPFAFSTGFGPANFAHKGEVSAVASRGYLYYANGVDPIRKVNPSRTGSATDTLSGIALPVATPGSQVYSDYPCAILSTRTSSAGTSGSLSMTNHGQGFGIGTYTTTGGTGTGLNITVNTIRTTNNGYGQIIGWYVSAWGSGYTSGDVLTVASPGFGPSTPINAQFQIVIYSTGSSTVPITGTSGWGYTANSSFTVNITDISGGSGTGGQITCYTDSNGAVYAATVNSAGSGYTQGIATVPAPPAGAGNKQAFVTVYTQTNSNVAGHGAIVGADVAGPMNFAGGRQWTVALQNSQTGHTSDVFIGQVQIGPLSGITLNQLTASFNDLDGTNVSNWPTYIGSPDQTAGFTQIPLTISVPTTGLDPQVDTVILLAGADGQGLSTLYEVVKVPLSSFTLTGSFYVYQYADSLADAITSTNNIYGTANTLLEGNIWAETDSSGNINGVIGNVPPLSQMKYLTLHQGRMFGTDGKTLFFSKSLDEVTTSTGLITSKWEECWPGDYQLPIALNNEQIIGIKSDGTNLHLGTEKSIFTVYGSDPTTFSVPAVAFAETGILANDAWSVIFVEGQPAGFVWVTKDLKVIHSDFSTYREIGTPVYPLLQTFVYSSAVLPQVKVCSLTQGPYNLVFISLPTNTSLPMIPQMLVYETRLSKWYEWGFPSVYTAGMGVSSPFVYQFPTFTGSSSQLPGAKYLFFWRTATITGTPYLSLHYYNPSATTDLGGTMSWAVQTSWQDFGDPTSIKVINELELTSATSPTATLYGATSEAQFESGGNVLKTGAVVAAPIASLGVKKFYTAGAATAAKFYSIGFNGTDNPGVNVLTSFSAEAFPMARI